MAHLVMPNGHPGDEFLVYQDSHDRFDIEHPTIQIELGNAMIPRTLAPDNVI